MDILYGKRFSKDLDTIQNESKTRKRLIELIKKIKEINSLSDLKGVKKSKAIRIIFVSGLEITDSV